MAIWRRSAVCSEPVITAHAHRGHREKRKERREKGQGTRDKRQGTRDKAERAAKGAERRRQASRSYIVVKCNILGSIINMRYQAGVADVDPSLCTRNAIPAKHRQKN